MSSFNDHERTLFKVLQEAIVGTIDKENAKYQLDVDAFADLVSNVQLGCLAALRAAGIDPNTPAFPGTRLRKFPAAAPPGGDSPSYSDAAAADSSAESASPAAPTMPADEDMADLADDEDE